MAVPWSVSLWMANMVWMAISGWVISCLTVADHIAGSLRTGDIGPFHVALKVYKSIDSMAFEGAKLTEANHTPHPVQTIFNCFRMLWPDFGWTSLSRPPKTSFVRFRQVFCRCRLDFFWFDAPFCTQDGFSAPRLGMGVLLTTMF
ncbi:hypothetical protein R6Q59_026547 [Mikania micrantha]